MKISEMDNIQASEALIRLAAPLSNICDDEKLVEMIDRYTKAKNEPVIRIIGRMLPEAVGYALKEHRDDFFEIVGALTNKTAAEVAKMNFLETIKVVRESYDGVLNGFFTSSVRQIKEAAEKS